MSTSGPGYSSDPQFPYAALDLGSNSFHLLVVRDLPDGIQVIDRHREMVRLGRNLGAQNLIAKESMSRALSTLERISQRIRDLPHHNVRVVGTNALRKAKNSTEFIGKANDVIGHEIEIISGFEEARLIYLGVAHSLEDNADRRLVVDIGGGSTELTLGSHFVPEIMESLHMGCVSLTEQWFADGRLNPKSFTNALNHARRELEVIERIFDVTKWDSAIGSSGTIMATQDAIRVLTGKHEITADGLEALIDHIFRHKTAQSIDLQCLSDARKEVIAGGLAILKAVLMSLNIKRMQVSDGALREGVIHDLLGRVHDQDIRNTSIAALAKRFRVDESHGRRVAETAQKLRGLAAQSWDLGTEDDARVLEWAALLHEIGKDISHSSYHKHGGYLLEHLDIPGLSRREQHVLATLVRFHRRRYRATEFDLDIHELRLCILLRLAVVLRRNRTDDELPPLFLSTNAKSVRIAISKEWLNTHRLTDLDLAEEEAMLASAPISLEVERL